MREALRCSEKAKPPPLRESGGNHNGTPSAASLCSEYRIDTGIGEPHLFFAMSPQGCPMSSRSVRRVSASQTSGRGTKHPLKINPSGLPHHVTARKYLDEPIKFPSRAPALFRRSMPPTHPAHLHRRCHLSRLSLLGGWLLVISPGS